MGREGLLEKARFVLRLGGLGRRLDAGGCGLGRETPAHLKQGRADEQWMERTWWSLLNALILMDVQIKACMFRCDRCDHCGLGKC